MTEQASKLMKEHYDFKDLVALMELLRSEEGCPWDRAQTHESIRKNLIEECYEAIEGIDRKDDELLCEELGDILLQVVFHAQIAQDEGAFTMERVIDGICRKMVRRHPHIFSDENYSKELKAESAYFRWEQIKQAEKDETNLESSLDRVARTLPSLMRSQKLIKKAVQAGRQTSGERTDKEELRKRYEALCLDAEASGVDLEELGYRFNEDYIRSKATEGKKTDEN